jgi:Family of unknown function (DUF5829)
MKILPILLLFYIGVFGQKKIQTDCNTVFVCIDAVTYQKIFTNTFLRDTIFICKEATTTTADDTYTGKYAIGKMGTIEFLKPASLDKLGNHLYDWGIEFKTRETDDVKFIYKNAQKLHIKVDTTTTILHDADTALPWYQSVILSQKKSNYELSILAYQKSYLNYLGFTKEEINTPMTFDYFNTTISNGRKYPRQFNNISSVTVQVDSAAWRQLKQYCLLNNMKQIGNAFYNKDFVLKYQLVHHAKKMYLKKIEVNLLTKQPTRTISIDNKVVFTIKNTICSIVFN